MIWLRRLFHAHCFEQIAVTYSAPLTDSRFYDLEVIARERAAHGCTTFVMECIDPECGEMKTVVALGKMQA
jgi:hypothetical protein